MNENRAFLGTSPQCSINELPAWNIRKDKRPLYNVLILSSIPKTLTFRPMAVKPENAFMLTRQQMQLILYSSIEDFCSTLKRELNT